jgi:hypothetical protein
MEHNTMYAADPRGQYMGGPPTPQQQQQQQQVRPHPAVGTQLARTPTNRAHPALIPLRDRRRATSNPTLVNSTRVGLGNGGRERCGGWPSA